MALTAGKKKLAAALGAGALALAGYGVYASSLTVSDSSANAVGNGTVASGCDTSVTSNAGTTTWDGTLGAYVINAVTIAGVDDVACNGKTLTVNAVDSGNASLANGSSAVTTSTTSYSVSLSAPVKLSDLSKFGILIR